MELREFAEQVVFSTSLDKKLLCPEVITDDRPGKAIEAPEMPGRPAVLQFKLKESNRSQFPGTHELENEEARSKLLHFFANHELLATELMALVLLKFPDAPSAFRKGVLQTLKDEQAHTRMYIARMRACGMDFGDLPLSGYFWRSVSPMQHPLDYVSSLCLTFEQANLDFSKHFADEFKTVGDVASAKLMERIYRDEIGHVAYGLKWFRRWKDPQQTDWDAFCRQLRFPLSPQRAKGFTINVAGREAAGLDPKFIKHLSVYSQSRGRTPNVFVFNALAEGHIARGREFHPVKKQLQLVNDLENLPQFLCRKDDVVLVQHKPSIHFLSTIQQAGFDLPEFAEFRGGAIDRENPILNRKLNGLKPWAWSPDSVELLEPLAANVTGSKAGPRQRFDASIAELYSKGWSAGLLRDCLSMHEGNSMFCDPGEVGVVVRNVDEAGRAIKTIREQGHHKLVVKEAIGLAGSNAIRLWEPGILDTQKTWVERAFDLGIELVVEPWLDRVADFSIQLEMIDGGLQVLGYTGLTNDLKGQFKGNWAEPNFRKRIPARVLSGFKNPHIVERELRAFYAAAITSVETELVKRGFEGPIGIDAFVYCDAEGALRVKPIVEINPRYTMGRLTIELMKNVAPGSRGEFRILNTSDLKKDGHEDFASFARSMTDRDAVVLSGAPRPRLVSGTVAVNDPTVAQAVLAMFSVSPVREP